MKLALTDRFIKTVEAPKTGRAEYHDERTKGLSLRVTQQGKKTFCFAYRRKGDLQKQRMTLGEYPYISLSDARNKATVAQSRLHQGLEIVEKKKWTFEAVAKLYWEKELKHIKTAQNEWRRLTKDAIPAWRNKDISSITVYDISTLLSKVRERAQTTKYVVSGFASPLGVPGANRLQTRLSRLFRFACEHGFCEDVPTQKIARKKEGTRDRTLTVNEIKVFWNLCTKSNIDEKTKIVLKLILLLGQRPGEICCMKWEDIDWQQATWLNVTSKTGEKNTVPLPPMAMQLLEPLFLSTGYVFKMDNPEGHLKRHSVTQAIRRCRIKKSILLNEKFTPHDLRRTMRSTLAELGVRRDIAERIISHKIKGVEGVYDRYDYLAEKREALMLWDTALQKIIESNDDELVGDGWAKIVQSTKNQQLIFKAQNILRQINQDHAMQQYQNLNAEVLVNVIAALGK